MLFLMFSRFLDIITLVLLIIWAIYTVKSINKLFQNFSFSVALSKSLASLILINTCATISLGVNYNQPSHPEGIAMYGLLTRLIIPDYGWSRESYYSYFKDSFDFTLSLLFLFLIKILIEKIIKTVKK